MNILRDLLFLNLTLQIFDGLFSYQVFSLGAEEANPIVAAAISNWGVIYGLLYKKTLLVSAAPDFRTETPARVARKTRDGLNRFGIHLHYSCLPLEASELGGFQFKA